MHVTPEAPQEPALAGFPNLLTLRVENRSEDLLLLDRAWADGTHHLPVEWLERPLGAVSYEAGRDRYVLHRGVPTRSQVEVARQLLEPGAACEGLLRVFPLRSGPLRVRARGWRLPLAGAEGRVYASRDWAGRRVVFARGVPRAEAAWMIVRRAGAPPWDSEARLALDVRLGPGARSALEAGGEGARLLLRLPRPAAWAVETSAGLLLCGEGRRLRLGPSTADLAVLRHVAEQPPGEPLRVLLPEPLARGLASNDGVPFRGDSAQRLLPPEGFWALLEAVEARGLRVRARLHSPAAGWGLTVEGP
ncbi:MAG: hypothetical protein D6731_15165 [Planctomycetota bacterium]|nr:MAG: hypothetical protein D6731_15165 [Planctomycetota bacterium]